MFDQSSWKKLANLNLSVDRISMSVGIHAVCQQKSLTHLCNCLWCHNV